MGYENVKYLDPKNDLTFRKIFGQNEHLIMSLLNSLLPLEKGQKIIELTYQDPALIPIIPELKHSIVDVRCIDNFGRQFIVEMQMYWTNSFKSRMLFNSGKAYVKQLDKGDKYRTLQPVYGLSLVNQTFMNDKQYEDIFYHHYRMVHKDITDEVISGIQLIFIELPKFKAITYTEKKAQYLWLKFLTEVDEDTVEVSKELSENKEIKEALDHLQVSAFTKEELQYYEKYWDQVRIERSAIEDAVQEKNEAIRREKIARQKAKEAQKQKREANKRVKEERRQKEEAQKREEEAQKQKEEERRQKEEAQKQKHKAMIKLALRMKKYGETIEEIQQETGLSADEINNLQPQINAN